jgi:hypothetical protein
MNYSFLKKFRLQTSIMLGCLFTLDAGPFNFFEHVPNPETSLSHAPIDYQAEMIAAISTRGIDQLNINECLTNYVVRTNIYYSHNSVTENGISIRAALAENIKFTSNHKFLSSEDLNRLEIADELTFLHNWQREMTDAEFYRSIHYLREEADDPFTLLTAYTQQLAYLYKKAYGSLDKALEPGYWSDSIKHVANFCRYVNRCRTLLYETQELKATWEHTDTDWSQYDYLWPHIYRNNAMLCRHGEVFLGDYEFLLRQSQAIELIDTFHDISNVLANEALMGADGVMQLMALFTGMM